MGGTVALVHVHEFFGTPPIQRRRSLTSLPLQMRCPQWGASHKEKTAQVTVRHRFCLPLRLDTSWNPDAVLLGRQAATGEAVGRCSSHSSRGLCWEPASTARQESEHIFQRCQSLTFKLAWPTPCGTETNCLLSPTQAGGSSTKLILLFF